MCSELPKQQAQTVVWIGIEPGQRCIHEPSSSQKRAAGQTETVHGGVFLQRQFWRAFNDWNLRFLMSVETKSSLHATRARTNRRRFSRDEWSQRSQEWNDDKSIASDIYTLHSLGYFLQ